MEQKTDRFIKELVCEPVTRTDGNQLWLYKVTDGKTSEVSLEVYAELISAGYSYEEVIFLGQGDWDRGILRIGQRYYFMGSDTLLSGETGHFYRAFNTEIKQWKKEIPEVI